MRICLSLASGWFGNVASWKIPVNFTVPSAQRYCEDMPYNEQPISIEHDRNFTLLYPNFVLKKKAIKEKGWSWISVVKAGAVSKFHLWCWAILNELFGLIFTEIISKPYVSVDFGEECVLNGLVEFAWCLEGWFGDNPFK